MGVPVPAKGMNRTDEDSTAVFARPIGFAMVIGARMADRAGLFQLHPEAHLRSQNLTVSILTLPSMVQRFKPSLIRLMGRIVLRHTVRASLAIIIYCVLMSNIRGEQVEVSGCSGI